ncbi:hypothetical protein RRG08_064407 [Elysia crispata]|uniref:Uncharacterized protein n=1 Tax=Elysia crispata TaxID=231223 RepID=A0AAE1D8S1_9GAST|nr:hypothetical protein RRG08_064407 [Elysia crispata]
MGDIKGFDPDYIYHRLLNLPTSSCRNATELYTNCSVRSQNIV